jgi:hypothetical protein
MNVPLDIFNFVYYDYEVAFEYRDSGFFRRLFSRKKDHLAYYIRKVEKASEEREEEVLLSCRRDYEGRTWHGFFTRSYGDWKAIYWGNPGEPQDLLMRVDMKLRPTQDNVTFSTASLSSNLP